MNLSEGSAAALDGAMTVWQSEHECPLVVDDGYCNLVLVRVSLTSAHACPPLTSSSSVRALRTGWQRRVRSAPSSHCSLATNR